MRIESIHIHGFGCLVERKYNFPESRAALVLEDNESGKSTLAAAIIAGLCGFPNRKQAGEIIKQKDIYKPWNSDNYSIEMDITADGRRLKIERDFTRDSFVVRDRDTNKDISAEFVSDLTSQFLGLPVDDFRRVAFISGKEVHSFSSSKNLQARLSALIDGSQEDSSADMAIAALESAGYTLDGRSIKIETAISRLTKSIDENKRSMSRLDAAIDAVADEASQLDDEKSLYETLTARIDALENEYRFARLAEVRAQIQSASINSNEVTALKSELSELEQYANFPAERSTQLANAVSRLKERRSQLIELNNRLENLNKEAVELQARLDAAKQFASLESEDLTSIGVLEQAIKTAQDTLTRKREEMEREKRLLTAEGVDLDCVLEDRAKFQSISETQREFLRSYNETSLQLTADQSRMEAAAADVMAQLHIIGQKSSQRRFAGFVLFGAGLTIGIILLALFILHKIPPIAALIGTLSGVVAAAVGAMNLMRAYGAAAESKARLTKDYEETQARIDAISSTRQDNINRLQSIAEQLEYSDVQAAITAFRNCERSLVQSQSITSLQAQLEQAEESLQSATERALRRMSGLGMECNSEDILDTLSRVSDRLSKYLTDRGRLREVERNISVLMSDISAKQGAVEEEKKVVSAILSEAGIDNSLDLDDALARFSEFESHHRNYRQIRDIRLPDAQKRLLSEDVLKKLAADEFDLAAQVEGKTCSETLRPSSDVDVERQEVRKEHDLAVGRIRELEKSVGACVNSYRREYPVLQQKLGELEAELEKVNRFAKALKIARDLMKNVSENTHRRWAAALNEQAAAILPSLNPDYDTLCFDDSLSFTIRHTSDNRIIEKTSVDACLSTGAKDQIYLAVRLACCGELSRLGENIPVILDDPFMAADDIRFQNGLRFLAENIAKENQVIILSCHRERHIKQAQEQWFSGSVEIIDL